MINNWTDAQQHWIYSFPKMIVTLMVNNGMSTQIHVCVVTFRNCLPLLWHTMSVILFKLLETSMKKKWSQTLIFWQLCIFISCGMVFVTTTASRSLSSILLRAGPEKMPCVKMAYTLAAPASCNLFKWQEIFGDWETLPSAKQKVFKILCNLISQ